MVEGLSSPGLCTAALLLLVSPGFPPVWKCSEREMICFLARAIGEFQVNSIAPLLPDRNALQPTGDVGREQILQCGSDLLLLTLVSSCGSGCPGQGTRTAAVGARSSSPYFELGTVFSKYILEEGKEMSLVCP